ncbi:Putative pyridoxal phosphate-dependent aminotransferase EpsN [Eubacterium callanderi]|uniref:DegT/DnrJ/EryC1/StrS family aminotransferase n=1 Tax=Eubacterium callanderi TaxID=53442 RepID=UPI0029FEEF18|nr:DegT/DnrJ/EryC1/StrS family aminotransferase [Eubacterium callanderi]WPK68740.1 Putative pyridoxal phosphate-dependent aminotransferase EpsN [Eubacterium callanderi]WPK73038.1 Putative pyridoxal phosphate-dependent aminotransferase EpsN [Eubacterium callanderi]
MEKPEKIYLSSPHMGGEEMKYIQEAFDTNWIAPLGKNVNQFEKEMAAYVGVKTGAALSAGTAALHLGLKALGVGEGDVVFCSSLTFSASANPIIYMGAKPVFIDSEPETWNMSPIALEKAYDKYPHPKAVIIVDLYGQAADYEKLSALCKAHHTPILEDAAEALGATYQGQKCGTFGDLSVLSFNGNKIITTSGGGMLLSNDEALIQKARFWSTQSRENERHYEHKELGYNYRMSNIVAGIGRGQLKVLDERIAKKKQIFETYKEAFTSIDTIEMMPVSDKGKPNYWLSCMTLKESSSVKPLDIMLALEKENIESRPVWKPMHLQPYFRTYDFFSHWDQMSEQSIAEDIFNRGVCLPSDTKMSEVDIHRIIRIVKGLF